MRRKNSICGIRTHALQAGDLKSSPLTARARYLANNTFYFFYLLPQKRFNQSYDDYLKIAKNP